MSFEEEVVQTQSPVAEEPSPKRLESVSQAVGFDVPAESIQLPSQGLLYPPDHPFHGATTVEIKCMTAKEEDLLTSRALIKNGTLFSKLIQSCILNKSVDAESLLVGDRNAILVAIRVTGYGPEYGVRIACGACGEEYENEFNLSALQIKRLNAAPVQEGTNAFSFVLPVTKKEVIFKLLTGVDEKIMEQAHNAAKKEFGAVPDTNVTSRLFHSILSIGGVSDRSKLKYMVQNLPARDSRALRRYMDSIEPDLQMEQSAACPHCGEGEVVDIPLSKNFLWPE